MIFFLAIFLVCALTTSQSTATRTIVPIGLAAGLSPALITGMWAGSFAGIYTLPTNGTQIAAANFDLSGTTKLGTKLIDHSYFIPMLVLALGTAGAGCVFAVLFFGVVVFVVIVSVVLFAVFVTDAPNGGLYTLTRQ